MSLIESLVLVAVLVSIGAVTIFSIVLFLDWRRKRERKDRQRRFLALGED